MHIFVSYSRIDQPFVEDLVPLLREIYGLDNIWFDQNLHGGEKWWSEILRQIDRCDIFLYLLTNESVKSSYCQAEYREATRLRKLILPVQIRSKTRIPNGIREIQFVDLSGGLKDYKALNKLYAAITQISLNSPSPALSPVESQPTPTPKVEDAKATKLNRATLTMPQATIIGALITGILGLTGVIYANSARQSSVLEPATQPVTLVQTQTVTQTTSTPIAGFTPITQNTKWNPVHEMFDGVEMVLVPSGCFLMGSDDGLDDEKPTNRQCFNEPFWIDMTEVTNSQYGSSGNFQGDGRPRESVTWFEAVAYCNLREDRLPTEAEWEYAARGPSALVYPWGNTFVADYTTYGANSAETADVTSRPMGASWVGALNLSGNVREWVSSIYKPYPYDPTDGREIDGQADSVSPRGLRGGSWNAIPQVLRAGARGHYDPNSIVNGFGFRCARSYSP